VTFAASIVVSSRDRPEMLLECLASLAAQATARAVEVVAVEQSGPDRRIAPRRAAALFEGTPFTFRHVVSGTVGASRGRNLGIRRSTGPVVAVTDDDCRADPGWIEALCAAFAADRELAMVCGRVLPDGEGMAVAVHAATEAAAFRRGDDPSALGSGNNAAFRRAALEAVGGYDERLGPGTPLRAGEDTELFYRVVRSGLRAEYRPEPVVYHRAWRRPEERLELAWCYGLGSGVYLAREVLARRDPRAAAILARRVVRAGLVPWLGNAVLGRAFHRRVAGRGLAGTLRGCWAVLSRRRDLGIDRDWVRAVRGPDVTPEPAPVEAAP